MKFSQWVNEVSRFAPVELKTEGGLLLLEEREPLLYQEVDGIEKHPVREGETSFTIAQKYYHLYMKRACRMYWAILDFNSIVDSTMKLKPGSILLIPPLELIQQHLSQEPEVFV